MNNKTMNKWIMTLLAGALSLSVACGDDDTGAEDTNVGEDTSMGEDTGGEDTGGEDTGMTGDITCESYCTTALATCDFASGGYTTMEQCVTWCSQIGIWETGTEGDTTGNTIACRATHLGLATPDCASGGYTGGDNCGSYCENYCNNLDNTCKGSDALYANAAECMTACDAFNDEGLPGATAGDSVQCRIYHGGAPAFMSPDTHCPHAGPMGGAPEDPTCVLDTAGFDIRLDDPSAYTRVDRVGMPAVSTALITNKTDYNDADPSDDADLVFAGELLENLGGLHSVLDGDIEDAGLTPCSMDPSDPADPTSLPSCVAQEVAPGLPVVSLVVPDTITVNVEADAGFPNGRRLADPVMDVTLGVILLDLTTHSATTLVGVLNPMANDLEFGTEFPYLAEAH